MRVPKVHQGDGRYRDKTSAMRNSRARKPWSAHCELKNWNFGGSKCLIHSLFTVWPPPTSRFVRYFFPLIHCLCAFFRPLLTPVSTAPYWRASQFTVCASRFTRLRAAKSLTRVLPWKQSPPFPKISRAQLRSRLHTKKPQDRNSCMYSFWFGD